MTIKKQDNTEVSGASVLMTYFGKQAGQTVADFANEVKALSPESKEELVRGAAEELGYTVTD